MSPAVSIIGNGSRRGKIQKILWVRERLKVRETQGERVIQDCVNTATPFAVLRHPPFQGALTHTVTHKANTNTVCLVYFLFLLPTAVHFRTQRHRECSPKTSFLLNVQ
jgi:hypothetical protein